MKEYILNQQSSIKIMKKTLSKEEICNYFTYSSQIWRRLLILSMFVCSMSLYSMLFSQQNDLLNISTQVRTIRAIIEQVEQDSPYVFFYNHNDIDLDREVKLKLSYSSIQDLLSDLFPLQNYEIVKYKIVILPLIKVGDKRSVKGVVYDDEGQAVLGATVLNRDTGNGTITDDTGSFEVVGLKGDTLEISYVGFHKVQLPLTDKLNYKIYLAEELNALDEVVVVGYGTQKKINVIGAMSSIYANLLSNGGASQVSNSLAGQMAGVTVVQRSGQPGIGVGEIRVRGVGTFYGGNLNPNKADPLVLVDGVVGDLNDLNADDIYNITVLKDAASASIYGARAANGVILVTTKIGSPGKVNISYSGNVGWSRATELPKFVDSWEWASLYNEASGHTIYSPEEILSIKNNTNPYRFGNVHYLDRVLNHTAFQTTHDLSINGGNQVNKYLISFGYLSQDGLVQGNDFEKYNFRVNLANQLTDRMKLTSRISGFKSRIDEPAESGGEDIAGMLGLIQQAVRIPAIYPAVLPSGEYGLGPTLQGTPISSIESASFYKNEKTIGEINLTLDYKILKGLDLSFVGAYRYTDVDERKYRATQLLEGGLESGPSTIQKSSAKDTYYTFQALLNYELNLNKNHLNFLAGYSWEEKKYRYLYVYRDQVYDSSKPDLSTASPNNQRNESAGYDWAMQSFFGRLRYNFDERYLLEMTLRNDGSSRFAPENQYALFPSIGIGWRISEEQFFKDSNLSWLSSLKLRSSLGRLGNENSGDYTSRLLYQSGYDYPFGNELQTGVAIVQGRDESRGWEKTKSFDVGVESILWNGMLSFNFSYYYKRTTGVLNKPSTISWVWGLDPAARNSGMLENKGVEFELAHQNSIRKFKYDIHFNLSTIHNKVLSLGTNSDILQPNGMRGNGTDLFVGYPIHMYYGYRTDGVFLDQADIDSWYDQSAINPNPQPGDLRYLPLDRNDKSVDPIKDRSYLGSRIPKVTYGLRFGASYQNFDFSILFQGISKVKGRLDNYAGFAFKSEVGNVQRWQQKGAFNPDAPMRYPAYPRLEQLPNVESANTYLSDYWLLDASYLRIKHIRLGYTLAQSITNKIKLEKVNFYLLAVNPFTFHNYPDGWDPEINTSGDFYPILKTYSLGVNIQF